MILGVWRKGKEINLIVKLGLANDGQTAESSTAQTFPNIQNQGAGFEVPEVGLLLNAHSGHLVVTQAKGIALSAGLRRGDVIVEIGGVPVHSQADFNEALSRAGKNVSVLVRRGDNTVFLALILP